MMKEFASWLLRTLDATSAWVFILVFAVVALFRLPEIENGLTTQSGRWWLELVEPGTWATIAVTARVLGVPAVVRLREALSPTYRFRQLEQHAGTLADELSDPRNYLPRLLAEFPPRGTPRLETMIAGLKADLGVLGVYRTPPIQDVDGWNRVVPALRALMRVGALSDARSHDWTS